MPYKTLLDLEKSIAEPEQNFLETIANIEDTDNKITTPWIYTILERNQTRKSWDTAFQHWGELRKIFKKTQSPTTTILSSEAKQIKSDNYKDHVNGVANAILEFKITEETLHDAKLLSVIVIGLNKRFQKLDNQEISVPRNAFIQILHKTSAYSITKLLEMKTGENRSGIFKPIQRAIVNMIENNPLMAPLMPSFTTPRTERIFSPLITSPNSSNKMELIDIDNEAEELQLQLTEKTEQIKNLNIEIEGFSSLEIEIVEKLSTNQVIDYDNIIATQFDLNDEEQLAWKTFSDNQYSEHVNAFVNNYLHEAINYCVHLLTGEYQTPHEIMKPIITKMQEKKDELCNLSDETLKIQMKLDDLQALRKEKMQTIIPLLTAITQQSTANNQRTSNHKAEPETNTSFSLVRKFLKALVATVIGGGLGWGIGFAVGMLIGTILGGGPGSLFLGPLCGKIGAMVGAGISGIAASYYQHNQDGGAPPPNQPAIIEAEPPLDQNIFRRLSISPDLSRVTPEPIPATEPSSPTPTIIMSNIPASTMQNKR